MSNDFYSYDDDDEDSHAAGGSNLFLWTVFILLLIGLAFASWLGSFYVFGHPEEPRAYRILKKLHKIEIPRRFEVTAAPQGEFLSAQKLFEKYNKLSRLQLQEENALLMRSFITNYRESSGKVPYIKGRFHILDVYDLGKERLFNSGLVAVAQSADYPQMLIEHVYTTPPTVSVAPLHQMLRTGLQMSVERTLDLSAIIHVERVQDGRMLFTVVPLLYGTYALKQGAGTFGLTPPDELNLDAGLPITKTNELQQCLVKFANYRRANPAATPSDDPSAAPPAPTPELVRLDTVPDATPVPATGPAHAIPVATPTRPAIASRSATPTPAVASRSATPTPAVASRSATPTPAVASRSATPTPTIASRSATPTPTMVARLATPLPVATPSRVVATPAPATPALVAATPPPKVSPEGVPLTPFLAANPAPGLQTATGNTWRVYNAGKQPPGKRVTVKEAGAFADRGELGERIYLKGDFLVTASGEGKAILRPQAGATPDQPNAPSPRIIAEFPMGTLPPEKGSNVSRDEARAFEVRDVRQGAEGQINIYVREIVAP